MLIKVAVGRSLTDFIKLVAFPFFSHFQASCRMVICFSLSYFEVREHCGKETFCCIWEHLEKVIVTYRLLTLGSYAHLTYIDAVHTC